MIFSGLDKVFNLFKLSHAARSLHVSNFQIITDMGIRIFMIITFRQLSQLPRKSFSACIILPRSAITVTPPITKGFSYLLKQVVIGKYRPPFAHGDVVSRVKAERSDIAKRSDHLTVIG